MRRLITPLLAVCTAGLLAYLIYFALTTSSLFSSSSKHAATTSKQSAAGQLVKAGNVDSVGAPSTALPGADQAATFTANPESSKDALPSALLVKAASVARERPASDQQDLVSSWIEFALVALLLLALVLAFNLWLQYKRWHSQQVLKSPHIVTPDNFDRLVNSLNKFLHDLATQVAELRRSVHDQREETQSASIELTKTFLTLQSALDTRDQQLKKAEQGWEQAVFSRFVRRFAKIDEMLHEPQQVSPQQLLEQTQLLLRDALEECGIELFSPSLGADYRHENGVADNPVCIETDDASRAYQIAEVLTPGYRIARITGSNSVVIPAKVKVYVLREVVNG